MTNPTNRLTMGILDFIIRWADKKKEEKLRKQFGGIQTCPWCRQCAQSGPHPWHFKPWERDMFLDVLTCSVCGGTSLWRFEMGMIYIGSLSPPKPAFIPYPDYDIAKASLIKHSTHPVLEG